jgi:glycosyltransferase involved in cell wall biosynthesis
VHSPERPVVVHVLTRLILGGPTRPVLALLERLEQAGCRPVLVAGSPAPGDEDARGLLGFYHDLPVMRIASLVRPVAPLADMRALVRLHLCLQRLRPAVVHTHTAKAGAVGRAASPLTGRPLRVHTFHGHSLSAAASGRLAPAWRQLERLFARRLSDLVITVSPGQRDEIASLLGEKVRPRLRVVPLAFDAAAYRPPEAGRSRLAGALRAPDERLLAFVGRGVPLKGLDLLARAHGRLAGERPGVGRRLRVLVVGPVRPPVRRQLVALLGQGGIADRWAFAGPVHNPLPLIELTDGLVLPSRSEGTPVSIIEALSLGRPVLAAAVGGVPELLAADWEQRAPGQWVARSCAPRGRLVPADDEAAWVDALSRFVQSPAEVPGAPDARRAFVREVFSADARSAETLALYRELAATARWGRQRRLVTQPGRS